MTRGRCAEPSVRPCRSAVMRAIAAAGIAAVCITPAASAAPATRPAGDGIGAAAQTQPAGRALVAPVFVHGEGRAATGGIVVTPPVLLSEDDARRIIRDELARYGIRLERQDVTIPQVKIEPGVEKQYQTVREDGGYRIRQTQRHQPARPLQIDLLDPDKGVAVEYVAAEDYFELGGPHDESAVYVQDYRIVAENVAQNLRQQADRGVYGVFYDPAVRLDRRQLRLERETEHARWDEALQQAEARSLEQAAELLRRQVRDFAAWLAERGVIGAAIPAGATQTAPAGP